MSPGTSTGAYNLGLQKRPYPANGPCISDYKNGLHASWLRDCQLSGGGSKAPAKPAILNNWPPVPEVTSRRRDRWDNW